MKQKSKLVRGFTLIEMLVVVFIIGLMASIVIFAVEASRVAARDTRRKSDIQTIKTAAENYFNIAKEYPVTCINIPPDAPVPSNTSEKGIEASIIEGGQSLNLDFLKTNAACVPGGSDTDRFIPTLLPQATFDPINREGKFYGYLSTKLYEADGSIKIYPQIQLKQSYGNYNYNFIKNPGVFIYANELENTNDMDGNGLDYGYPTQTYIVSTNAYK